MATTVTEIEIPAGEWVVDQAHSSANFEVEHAGLALFRGDFKPVDAKLISGEAGLALEGAVDVERISVDDESIRPHLLSPDFFDAERNPQIRFRSTEIAGSADDLRVEGELTMAGATVPVRATGRLRGPVAGPGGADKLAVALQAIVDRTEFGMDWQMDLPAGGVALANDVKLLVELELARA